VDRESGAGLLQQALDAHGRGAVAEAEELYRRLLGAEPGNFEAYLFLGSLCFEQRRLEEAVRLVRQSLRLRPASEHAHRFLGDVLQALDLPDEAVARYQVALAIQPNYAEAHNNLAVTLDALGRREEAAGHYDEALRLNPDYPEAHSNVANALQAAGRYDEAISHYRAALGLPPGDVAGTGGQEPALGWDDLAGRAGAVEALNGLGNALQAVHRWEDALPVYDAALVARPDHAEVLYNRGNALLALERAEEAAASYRAAIAVDPHHAQAHYNLGNALQLQHRRREAIVHYERAIALRPGFVEAINNMGIAFETLHEYEPAMTCFRAALGLQPQHLAAHHNLGNTLQLLGRLPEARAHLDAALRIAGQNAQVQRSLAVLCLREGQREEARRHARLGFPGGIEVRPALGSSVSALRVLVLLSALGGNLSLDELLDQASCTRLTATVEFWEAGGELPPHDVIFNAIGEADRCADALREAAGIIAASGRPLINPPERVLATGRLENAARLGELPGVIAPRMRRYPRAALLGRAAASRLQRDGLGWPLLLRTPGFHTGEHFAKVDGPLDLARAVAQLPGAELVAMQFLDARGSDGNVRKYRVMMVAGRLLPLHLAISTRWMVHYFNADMGEARHEAEEAAFLSDMPGTLGPEVMAALDRIAATVDLDYGGIDFGLDAMGRVLLFEANATMVVPPPPAEERFRYRQPAADRVRQAVRELLTRRAGVAAVAAG